MIGPLEHLLSFLKIEIGVADTEADIEGYLNSSIELGEKELRV